MPKVLVSAAEFVACDAVGSSDDHTRSIPAHPKVAVGASVVCQVGVAALREIWSVDLREVPGSGSVTPH